tara:strand:- start:496 stop:870 length:375 start_codon:yes stop_codon:yes gene_type:complete
MELSTGDLQRFVGGQLEIQNPGDGYFFRGEVEKVSIEGEGFDAELVVRFSWLAKASGESPVPGNWENHDDLDYGVSLLIAAPSDIGDNRLCLNMASTGELAVFFPPDGSRLDPARVKGLELEKA